MEYPVVLKRKPKLFSLIFSGVFGVLSLVLAVYFAVTGGDFVFYLAVTAIFAICFTFNAVLSFEKAYIVDKDKFACVSFVLPKTEIPVDKITKLHIENDGTLRISYNTEEDFGKMTKEAKKFYDEGLCAFFINKKDMNVKAENFAKLLAFAAKEKGNDVAVEM